MQSNQDVVKLEKHIKASYDTINKEILTKYLDGLKQSRYAKLLQQDTTTYTVEERNIIIGELRILEKILLLTKSSYKE